MFKKLTAPYKYAPAKVSIDRIDTALAQGAQAEIQSPGKGNYKAVSMVTLKTLDGRIVDQWPLHGNINAGHKFVASYNRTLAARRLAEPQQGYPPQQRWLSCLPRRHPQAARKEHRRRQSSVTSEARLMS